MSEKSKIEELEKRIVYLEVSLVRTVAEISRIVGILEKMVRITP